MPEAWVYEPTPMSKWQVTASTTLPTDIDYSKYKTCEIEYEKSDADHTLYVNFNAMLNGEKKVISVYEESEAGKFIVPLKELHTGTVEASDFGLLTSDEGFAGSVEIKKVTFKA